MSAERIEYFFRKCRGKTGIGKALQGILSKTGVREQTVDSKGIVHLKFEPIQAPYAINEDPVLIGEIYPLCKRQCVSFLQAKVLQDVVHE